MTTNTGPGCWTCPRCKHVNPFCGSCTQCACPHTKQVCTQCTFENSFDAVECEICYYRFPEQKHEITQSQQLTVDNSGNSMPAISMNSVSAEPDINDDADDHDDDDFIDLTKVPAHHHKPQNQHFATETTIASGSGSNNGMHDDDDHNHANNDADTFDNFDTFDDALFDMHDNDNADDEFQRILEVSKLEHDEQQELRRLSSQFDADPDTFLSQLSDHNNNNNHTSNSAQSPRSSQQHQNVYGSYSHLFADSDDHESGAKAKEGRKRKQRSSDTDSENNNDDDDDAELRPPKKKQKAATKPKTRKKKKKQSSSAMEDDSYDLPQASTDVLNNTQEASDTHDDMELTKQQKAKIDKGFSKFVDNYIKGAYSMRTVCVEFGPLFKGRSKAFDSILSDTEWRPKTFSLPPDRPFAACENDELPEYVVRFKHYTLKMERGRIPQRLIYSNVTESELDTLKGFNAENVGNYFLKRLLDTQQCLYFDIVLVRLSYRVFHELFGGKNKNFTSLEDAIRHIKPLPKVKTINFLIENVATQQKILPPGDSSQGWHHWHNIQQMKDHLMNMFICDPTIHFTFTSNTDDTAKYMIRVARSLADKRVKKLRVNELTNSMHCTKGKASKDGTNKDVLFSSLLTISGVSEKKALAIAYHYPSIRALLGKYKTLDTAQGRSLLADITPMNGGRRIGEALSARIYHIWRVGRDGNELVNR